MESRKLELVGADSSENQIRIEIQDEQEISHDGIHTIQLQSPGGSSHFVKGLVVTNPSGNSISSTGQLQSDMSHGHTMLGSEIFLQDRSITLTDASSLGDETTGQIIQMVRLGTDENGETIIFVQPQEKHHESPSVVVLNQDHEMQQEVILPVTTSNSIPQMAIKSDPLAINMSDQKPELCSVDSLEGMEESSNAGDSTSNSKVEEDSDVSESEDDEDIPTRRCVVCLRRRKFTEDIFDSSKQLYFHIDVLIAHLNIQVKGTPANTGLCPDCMNYLQRWHVFNCAVAKRHEEARNTGVKIVEEKLDLTPYESRVYKNYKKLGRVQEVFSGATHSHYARRHLTEKDWDYFCDHLFHANSVKSEKSKELEKFISSREKLSKLFCLSCQRLIPNGKKGFERHMQKEHQQTPVLYPCDICGKTFPDRDMTASTEDYYPHWISHFYFNKCDDCGKQFPTKRALGQHRHAVHKNRQVKCDKCGKVLANKMSLDLHLLRHLPEKEKKKYMVKCKVCKKKIAQWNMKSHLSTHNDERPWKCDQCDATFKMKGALVSHRDVVHFNLKNHVCSICGDAFKSASSLRGHVRRHEGRKDYKCEVCLKEYYTYSALKGHKVVHQTARNFICETCGKAFKKKKALDEHVTLHTGVKPHRCPICGREIRVKSNLYKHMKIHKKSQAAAAAAATTTSSSSSAAPQTISNAKAIVATSREDAHSNDLNSSMVSGNPTTWPSNGTMMVTLDNGTVVSDVTPLVVSFVTAGNDGIHSGGSVLELNSEQHAQLINAVAVQSTGVSNANHTETYITPHTYHTSNVTHPVHSTVETTDAQASTTFTTTSSVTTITRKRGKISHN